MASRHQRYLKAGRKTISAAASDQPVDDAQALRIAGHNGSMRVKSVLSVLQEARGQVKGSAAKRKLDSMISVLRELSQDLAAMSAGVL